VFVESDATLRPYTVEVQSSAGGCGAKWIKIGESKGVTQTFTLIPSIGHGGHGHDGDDDGDDDCFGAFIDGLGKASGDPALLHLLDRLGLKGIQAIRITDKSNRLTSLDDSPSASPGVSIRGVGFSKA
jgi:hypothetical protein